MCNEKNIIPEVTVDEFLAHHQHRFEPQSTGALPKCMWQSTLKHQPKLSALSYEKYINLSQRCLPRYAMKEHYPRGHWQGVSGTASTPVGSKKYSCAPKTHMADYTEASAKTACIELWKIYQPQPKVSSEMWNERTLSQRWLTRSFRHFINTSLSHKADLHFQNACGKLHWSISQHCLHWAMQNISTSAKGMPHSDLFRFPWQVDYHWPWFCCE